MAQREWIADDGTVMIGKYRGVHVDDLIRADRSYVEWIVREVDDITDEDREIFIILLRQSR